MQDQLQVFDRRRQPTDALRDMLAGRSTFLVCGGPSANRCDLSKIADRGIWSLAVNNMAAHARTSAFVCADPPAKFHDVIWTDPSVMKFVPLPKLTDSVKRGSLRTKRNGEFYPLTMPDSDKPQCVQHCPNVWGFGRRSWWAYDDTFFTDVDASWGNGNQGVSRTGNPKTFCTMLLAIRLLYYLGSRRIFLVGVDFTMSPQQSYAFAQNKPGVSQDVANCNAHQYGVVNYGLCSMVTNGVFQRAGLEIYNCNQKSGLRAFPFVPYDAAVSEARRGFPTMPLDLAGWYEKEGALK